MASFDKNRFHTERNDWETPDELFNEMNAEFCFTVDLAASAENAKCKRYFTADDNALRQPWKGVCWLNPPYGEARDNRLAVWVKKAWEESQRGATVVMLIPARTNTNWFHDYCLRYGEVRFVRGRPLFKGAKHGLPQPLAFVIFRTKAEA